MVMRRIHLAAVLAFLAIVPVACSVDHAGSRAANTDDLERALELAFQADTLPVTFRDTAIAAPPPVRMEPEREAVREPVRRAEPPRTPRQQQREPMQAPRPAPREEEPMLATPREPRIVTRTASVGTNMSLTLNETLSTETNRVGDPFTATLRSDVRDAVGEVLIPAGATVRGRLTEVSPSGHVGETGILKLAFEAISFDGNSYAMDGTVVRANPQRSNRTSARSQAGRIAAGAAAGAVVGRALGKDTRSTVKGAVIGAAAGTAIAMGTADVDVVLPAGSAMDVRLDSPILIRTVIDDET